jgi:hypothetical protein
VRKYTTSTTTKPVVVKPTGKNCRKGKNTLSKPICTFLQRNGMCWAAEVKMQCWTSCGVCTDADVKNTGTVRKATRGGFTWTVNEKATAVIVSLTTQKVYIGGFSKDNS